MERGERVKSNTAGGKSNECKIQIRATNVQHRSREQQSHVVAAIRGSPCAEGEDTVLSAVFPRTRLDWRFPQ